ncbi:transcription elongation factor A N-terminal and central domain-containing protein isoform X1 [Astyanax mexicanus]|uniref:transcription elongation factor A N-terminal and central domain-containing protein isoform X1 n=1 Tax=Astyanax mexicanus TaxID=7994 RepID=UPI0020CACE76|nr:transcription elongation factor A N-terminal and central domain-containing protein isoform X1 [Astyanax mexicanus]
MDTKELIFYAIQIEKLQKGCNYEEVSSLLADLSNSPVTLEQLQTTDIAKTVYQLLKSCPVQTSVRKTAKELLSKWKGMYNSSQGHSSTKDTSQIKEHGPPEMAQSVPSAETETVLGPKVQHSDVQQMSSSDSDLPSSKITALLLKADDSKSTASVPENHNGEDSRVQSTSSTDSKPVRTKCVELLIQALIPDQKPTNPEDTRQISTLAQAIEQHIHALHRQNQAKYKSCVRSRVANLKNPKNPHLRQGLLTGTLTPEVFARMSVEEMASEELRSLREGYTAAAISEHQLPQQPEGTTTTKVRCRRCQSMNCRVTQVSRGTLFLPSWVRSGNNDEDAMTFMTCAECGEQWYHSRWVCL